MLTTTCAILYTDQSTVVHKKEIVIKDSEMRELLNVPNGSLHEAVQTRGNVILEALWSKWLSFEAAVGDIKGISISFDYAELPVSPPIPQSVET